MPSILAPLPVTAKKTMSKRRMPGREQQNCDKSPSTFQIKCDEPPLNL
nr:hypothetical protein [Enterobacteriaceae bacterium]UWM21753.1 hypothetical protein [Escherichia coli]